MGIGVLIFKINNLFLELSAFEPRLIASPPLPRVGHGAKAVVTNDIKGRQIKIGHVLDRFMKDARFRRHVPAKNERPPFLALVFERPGDPRRRAHQTADNPRAAYLVLREARSEER